jgi:low temperature requirement protein LtrA
MTGRDPEEEHRVSTPLELFFDLCFVVAVAAVAAELHHGLAEGHLDALLGYAFVFFAVWWAWVNYSWFASAYDTDDVLYRLLTFVIMAGVLVLAAGVPDLFGDGVSTVVVIGYAIMRFAMVALWLRAAHDHRERRRTALVFAAGIGAVQLLWIARLGVDDPTLRVVTFVVLAACELAVPYAAERQGGTPWHPDHIAERYGLFTIIVLGEVLLATTQGLQGTLREHGASAQLLLTVGGGLLIVFAMWWFYFKRPWVETLTKGSAFVFGYGHYFVFASAAAVGAALAAVVDVVQHEAHVAHRAATLFLAAALSVYCLALSLLRAAGGRRPGEIVPGLAVSVVALGVAGAGLQPGVTVLLIGVVIVAAVAHHVVRSAAPTVPVESYRRDD